MVKPSGRSMSILELRPLRYFVAVAEDLHFGRAARRLSITQPPLSAAIRRLEEDLGLILFDRDNKRVQLTAAGAAFLQKARDLLLQAEKTREFANVVASGRTGQLVIGFTGTMLYRGLADALASFASSHPKLELSLCEASTAEQRQLLQAGRLDAGFLHTPVAPENGLQSVVLCRERFVACLPASHPMACCSQIKLSALRADPFITFARSVSPGYHDYVLSLCDRSGFSPRIRIEGKQVFSVVVMVAHGLGVSVVPESLSRSGIRDVRFVPLLESEVRPTAYLAWHPKREQPGLREFVRIVESISDPLALHPGPSVWPVSAVASVISFPRAQDVGSGRRASGRNSC